MTDQVGLLVDGRRPVLRRRGGRFVSLEGRRVLRRWANDFELGDAVAAGEVELEAGWKVLELGAYPDGRPMRRAIEAWLEALLASGPVAP